MPLLSLPTERLRTAFLVVLAVTLAIRLALAAAIPFTGDEAYFYYWGVFPDFGYYDHPPMIGWVHALTSRISTAAWFLRLPAVLLPLALAVAVVALARDAGEERAYLAGIGFALLPVEVLFALVTTDTPLILFSALSVVAFAVALRRERPAGQGASARVLTEPAGNAPMPTPAQPSVVWLYALAGAFLGLAFLSKYFAALLGVAYLVFAVVSPRHERRWRGVAVVIACAIPFGLVNLAWNYTHCWSNILFNAYNRHEAASVSARTPLVYLATLLYVLSPVLVWGLLRRRVENARVWSDPRLRFLAVVVGAPLALFAVLSLAKTIGLHWLLAFVPPFFALAAFLLPAKVLRINARFLAVVSALHVAIVAVVLALPVEALAKTKWYPGIVMTAKPEELFRALAPYTQEFELAAEGYTPAFTLSYAAQRLGFGADTPGDPPVPKRFFVVYGAGSHNARQYDALVDLRRLDGRNLLVIRKSAPPRNEYDPYFREVEYRTIDVRGATFHVTLGRGFDYAAYRDTVLAGVRDRFYRVPAFLPQGGCDYCERYWGEACPTR
jgi:hypothetical protein